MSISTGQSISLRRLQQVVAPLHLRGDLDKMATALADYSADDQLVISRGSRPDDGRIHLIYRLDAGSNMASGVLTLASNGRLREGAKSGPVVAVMAPESARIIVGAFFPSEVRLSIFENAMASGLRTLYGCAEEGCEASVEASAYVALTQAYDDQSREWLEEGTSLVRRAHEMDGPFNSIDGDDLSAILHRYLSDWIGARSDLAGVVATFESARAMMREMMATETGLAVYADRHPERCEEKRLLETCRYGEEGQVVVDRQSCRWSVDEVAKKESSRDDCWARR